jgi:lipoprotein-anchoring transpeptidase ErfK/SrfK
MRKLGVAAVFVLGFAGAGAVPAAPPPPATPPAVIAPGVSVGGTRVGYLTPDAATAKVAAAFSRPLPLRVGPARLLARPETLGARAYIKSAVTRATSAAPGTKVPLAVAVNGTVLRSYAARLARHYRRVPVDARLSLRGLRPYVSADRPGQTLDLRSALPKLVRALMTNSRAPVRVPVEQVPAQVTASSFGPIIVIHRGSNRLYLYDGMRLWRIFGVATGQAAYPTPLGAFSIAVMWRNPWWYPPNTSWAKGASPIPPGPGNPLGTRWMGLTAPGVGIHGTPDAASIGYSASHGCIRMRIPEAEWLFNHVSIGTPVFIVAA